MFPVHTKHTRYPRPAASGAGTTGLLKGPHR